MKTRALGFRFIQLCGLLLPAFAAVNAAPEEAKATPPPPQRLHISPNGSDQKGDGSKAAPWATVAQALKRIDPDRPATIRLLPGVYREQFSVPPSSKGKALKIEGSEEGEAIFDGGEPIPEWTTLEPAAAGVFRVAKATSQTVRTNEGEYYDVWDAKERIRYRKQADLAGVKAYPAAVAVDEGENLLIHTSDGKEPRDLWRSRDAFAVSIKRDGVTVRNITFRNYTGGGSAHAIGIERNVRGTTIENCRFENIVCGILNDGSQTRIANNRMRDVSRGVESRGDEVLVEDCFIEVATGRFTFSDNNQHRRNGIRIYYPSRGGTVRRNVTAGSWAGLYIKTGSSLENALPILVEHNTFVDGINFGPKKHLRTTLRNNLIGPLNPETSIRRLLSMGVTFERNYFFAPGFREMTPLSPATNVSGPVPFVNLPEGDLSPAIPEVAEFKIGAPVAHCSWIPAIRRQLERETEGEAAPPVLRLVSEPESVASRQGAVLVATLNTPAEEIYAKVRRLGKKEWTKVPGQMNRLVEPAVLSTPAPVEPAPPPPTTPYLFDLTRGQLDPEQSYEAVVMARQKGGKKVESAPLSFRTTGDAKVIHVDPKATASEGDGSAQHPWTRLQQALDRALPGDTVELAAGVYTEPALLLHGGTDEHPLRIRGASKQTTLFDGGKEFSILLKLENAPHVTISDLTLRWFGDHGLMASDSPYLSVERCHFQNSLMRRGANGRAGLCLVNSPHARIAFNTFTTAENGALIKDSPAFTFTNNTAFANLYAGLQISNSSRDSVLTHNAFTFTGNASVDILERDRAAWERITCDFNNYGNRLNNGKAPERPENDFRPAPHYGKISGKAILRTWIALPEAAGEVASQSFYSMKSWRDFSGKDAHSIFDDPDYIDPLRNDFRVRPGSPHLLGDGRLIGAEGRLLPPASAATP